MNGFTTQQVRNLRRGVRTALGFGIAVSITANVIHSLTQPHAQQWQVGASAGLSALAPIVLFACVEMVSRIPMHSRVLGPVRLAVTLAIAGFSGWISYWHMADVASMLGEDGTAKYIYPLIIDGMMLVATISLIELGRLGNVVMQIEAQTERAIVAEQAAARRCKPGCTCGRHNRKAPVAKRRTTTRRVSAVAPTSPAVGGPVYVGAQAP